MSNVRKASPAPIIIRLSERRIGHVQIIVFIGLGDQALHWPKKVVNPKVKPLFSEVRTKSV